MIACEAQDRNATRVLSTPKERARSDAPRAEPTDLLEYAKQNSVQLSDQTPIPIYYQLFRLCRRYIVEGQLRPGDRFPSEVTVASSFNVSRATAHHAIQELLARGLLTRQRGRGTYVAERTYVELTLVSGEVRFSNQYIGEGEFSSRIVDIHQCVATPDVAQALHLSEGDRVHRMRRLRCIDERPFLLEESYLSAARFPGLDSHELVDGSLAATLSSTYDTPVVRCDRWLEASDALGQDTATLLEISMLSPILLLHGVGSTEANVPVVFMQAYVREGVSFHSLDGAHAPR